MLTDEQVDKIPLKEVTVCEIWNTHTTPELIKLLKITSPLVYKAMLISNQLNETLSPLDFNKLSEQFAHALYLGKFSNININLEQFTQKELQQIIKVATDELISKNEFLKFLIDKEINDGSFEMYNQSSINLKSYIENLRKIITSKSNSKTPKSMGEN